MSATSENNKRIAKNTLFLYVRMLLIMGVTLYTSRVVLQVLGVEDFGIYNVVGRIVALFSMFTGSLTSAINRFLTVELGNGNQQRLAIIFSTSVNIQLLLSVIICVFVELAGVWFLNNRMNIPAERLYAANWVLHTSILTFMTNLISVPYNAAIIAHERMKAFAYVSVLMFF
nr:MATE family efflux transporter [Parabacteroides goldsteinii]